MADEMDKDAVRFFCEEHGCFCEPNHDGPCMNVNGYPIETHGTGVLRAAERTDGRSMVLTMIRDLVHSDRYDDTSARQMLREVLNAPTMVRLLESPPSRPSDETLEKWAEEIARELWGEPVAPYGKEHILSTLRRLTGGDK